MYELCLIKILFLLHDEKHFLICIIMPNIDLEVDSSSFYNFYPSITRGHCDGARSCVVTATNSVYSDPCPGHVKYANLTYTCCTDQGTKYRCSKYQCSKYRCSKYRCSKYRCSKYPCSKYLCSKYLCSKYLCSKYR